MITRGRHETVISIWWIAGLCALLILTGLALLFVAYPVVEYYAYEMLRSMNDEQFVRSMMLVGAAGAVSLTAGSLGLIRALYLAATGPQRNRPYR